MSDLTKIAVDAMGGDGSPKKIIDGIIHNHKSNKKNLKVDCLVSRESLYEVLTSFMKTNLKPVYLGTGVTYDYKTKTKYERIEAYVEYANITQDDRIDDVLWLVKEILDSGLVRNNITKKQKEQLIIATENLPNHE